MTTIRIDPSELATTSSTLRSTAAELVELGVQLSSCAHCPMPPGTGADVTAFVATLDKLYDRIAVILDLWAKELDNRAAIAAADLNTSSTVGYVPLAASVTAAALPGSMIIGGGGSFYDSISGGSVGASTMVIGGGTGFNVTGGSVGASSMIIGGVTAGSQSDSNPATILAKAAETHRQRALAIGDRILSNPASTDAEKAIVYASTNKMNETTIRMLAPSRSDMEQRVGRLLTLSEYYDLVPEARPS